MADIVWQDVVDVASEMSSGVPSGFQTKILAHVNQTVNPAAFGGESHINLTLARAWLAAHYASMFKGGSTGSRGPVTSQSEGGVSQSFAPPAGMSGADLNRTSYGQNFLSLVRQSPVARAGGVA